LYLLQKQDNIVVFFFVSFMIIELSRSICVLSNPRT
jgi:hypothetical protein